MVKAVFAVFFINNSLSKIALSTRLNPFEAEGLTILNIAFFHFAYRAIGSARGQSHIC